METRHALSGWAVAVVIALVLVACGSESASPVMAETALVAEGPTSEADSADGSTSQQAEPTQTPSLTPASEAEEELDPAGEPEPEAVSEMIELAPADWEGLRVLNLPAMGGITFGVPDGYHVIHDGDMVAIRADSDLDSGGLNPTMIIARVYWTPPGQRILIDDMTSWAIDKSGRAEPTNEALTLLGEELEGWRFTAHEGESYPFRTFSPYPRGAVGESVWDPFPVGELFLAEVPGGVFAVGWTGEDDEALPVGRTLFDRVAPTIELARPFAETVEAVSHVRSGSESAPAPVPLPDGWPSPLAGITRPVDPGEHSNFGFETVFRFSVDDRWWVQPNFPGWLVLTGGESNGPGDRAIVFRSGATGLQAAVREGPVGPQVDLDLADLVANPPASLEILDSADVTIGGATGSRIRFEFGESIDCAAGEVCEYFLMTTTPYPPVSIRAGYQHELIHLDGGLSAPVTILVSSYDPAWFDRAQDLFDTIELDVATDS